MNKTKLQKIANKCFWDEQTQMEIEDCIDLEAYAKAILDECFGIIDKHANHLDDEMERGRADDLRAVGRIIKQYFGV